MGVGRGGAIVLTLCFGIGDEWVHRSFAGAQDDNVAQGPSTSRGMTELSTTEGDGILHALI